MGHTPKNKIPDPQGTLHVTDIPHEIVKANPEAPTEKLKLLTVDETIQLSIEKFDLSLEKIAQWKEEYAPLSLIAEDDKEGYKKLEEALRKIKKVRTGGDALRKELVADSLAIQRGINGRWNELEDPLREVEEPMAKRKKEIDNAKELAAAKLEEDRQKMLQGRVAALLENGMSFNGNYYVIGDTTSMDVVTLKMMDGEAFEAFKTRVAAQHSVIKAAAEKVEQDRKDQAAAAEALRLEQEVEAKRLQAEKDELARQRQELEDQKKAMQEQIAQSRRVLLLNAGFILKADGSMRISLKTGENSSTGTFVGAEFIKTADGKTWDNIYNTAIVVADEAKADNKKYLAEKAEAEAAEARRREEQAKKDEETRLEKQALLNRTILRQQILVDRYGMHQQQVGTPHSKFIRVSHLPNSDIFVLQNTIETLTVEEWEAGYLVIQKRLDEVLAAEKQYAADKLKAEQEKERLEAEKAEAARQLQLGDAEKMKEYTSAIRKIKQPELKDKNLNHALMTFSNELENFEELIEQMLLIPSPAAMAG